MPMTAEERKAYNKKYYNDNKENLLKKMATKETCDVCGKKVSHQNMLIKHKKSKRCVRATEEKNKLTLDKETYEKLMKLLKDT